MNKFWSLAIAFLAALMLAACSSGPKVISDSNPAISFGSYRTFAWISESPMANNPPGMNPLTAQRIKTAIEAGLTARGYRQVASPASADFAVSFTVGSREQVRTSTYPSGYQGTWLWGRAYYGGFPEYETYVTSYTQGRLAIDMFDVRSKQPAWHGWTEKRITDSIREDPSEAIQETVNAVLDAFPATGG